MSTDILWDTRAQVSIMQERIIHEKFPNLLVTDIHELLRIGSDLKLEAADGARIPHDGWVGINLDCCTTQQRRLQSPFWIQRK